MFPTVSVGAENAAVNPVVDPIGKEPLATENEYDVSVAVGVVAVHAFEPADVTVGAVVVPTAGRPVITTFIAAEENGIFPLFFSVMEKTAPFVPTLRLSCCTVTDACWLDVPGSPL